jgi:predicted ATP-grasp superfamily ATP-dependent carboligase
LYRLVDGLGKPFLFLAGFEPDLQWERFARAVVRIVEHFDVNLVTWIHSIPMPVPHTRPVGVTVHGNRPELIEGISVWKPTVEVPAAVGHILELRLTEAGRNIAGYVIHVPHYLAEAEYPNAAVAGLEYLGAATSLMLPTDRLREAGREVGRQIAEQLEASEEVQQVVSRLETRYDEKAEGTVRRSLLADENDELPNADALGAAVEAYLAREEPRQ